MDKSVVLAVAGSGKTKLLIDKLNLQQRFLIVTYTINNENNLKKRIISKFGYFPTNIVLYRYFTFLYRFCYRTFIGSKYNAKGFWWDEIPKSVSRFKANNLKYYLSNDRRLYHNRLARMLTEAKLEPFIVNRIEKYFDFFFVDEVQDFAGHDFNLLEYISCVNCEILFVGDFFQHTFDTSRDGATNRTLHNDYIKYQMRFKKTGLKVDLLSLATSYRCDKKVCEFISNKIGIPIVGNDERNVEIRKVTNEIEIEQIFRDDSIVKLFYWKHDLYPCYSNNWGASKGLDEYIDVCVVLNKGSNILFDQGKLTQLNPQTRNKLYVACTRTKRHLYFIDEADLKKYL